MRHPTPSQLEWMQGHTSDNRTAALVVQNTVCLVLAIAAVALRFASRVKVRTKIGLDDWLICGALTMLLANVITIYITARYGMGRHVIMVTNLKAFYLTSLIGQTFYNLCIPFIKFSILSLYARMFSDAIKWFAPTLWITAIFTLMVSIPQVFVHVFQCVPIDSLWNEYGPGYRVYCVNFHVAIVAFGVIHILTDWFILLLPIPIILGLSLDPRTKWSICSVFFLGGIVCIVSIVRLKLANNFESVDPSWDFIIIATISTAECALGIIVACMPTWRPLFKFMYFNASTFFSSGSGKSSHGATGSKGSFFARQKRSASPAGDLRSMIDHRGMGTGMVRGLSVNKGHRTRMSGSSIEKMLAMNAGSGSTPPQHYHSELEMQTSPWMDRNTASPASPMPILATTPSNMLGSEAERGNRGSGYVDDGYIDQKGMEEEARLGEQRWRRAIEEQKRASEMLGQDERARSASPNPKKVLGV